MIQLIARLALAVGFLLPVMDRLGILGAPGATGVTWGNWTNFKGYTAQILPFLNETSLSLAATIATVLECILALCLVVGFKTRIAGLGTAVLTGLFGLFMFIFLGPMTPFSYPVFVFTAAGLLLWKETKFKWSLDNYLNKRIPQ